MSIEDRVETVEEAILIMKNLLVSHNDRLDDYFEALNEERVERKREREEDRRGREEERREREESRKDFDFKLNALIDAQIRNETEIDKLKKSTTELRKSTTELKEASTELKEASQSQLRRIEILENKN